MSHRAYTDNKKPFFSSHTVWKTIEAHFLQFLGKIKLLFFHIFPVIIRYSYLEDKRNGKNQENWFVLHFLLFFLWLWKGDLLETLWKIWVFWEYQTFRARQYRTHRKILQKLERKSMCNYLSCFPTTICRILLHQFIIHESSERIYLFLYNNSPRNVMHFQTIFCFFQKLMEWKISNKFQFFIARNGEKV